MLSIPTTQASGRRQVSGKIQPPSITFASQTTTNTYSDVWDGISLLEEVRRCLMPAWTDPACPVRYQSVIEMLEESGIGENYMHILKNNGHVARKIDSPRCQTTPLIALAAMLTGDRNLAIVLENFIPQWKTGFPKMSRALEAIQEGQPGAARTFLETIKSIQNRLDVWIDLHPTDILPDEFFTYLERKLLDKADESRQ